MESSVKVPRLELGASSGGSPSQSPRTARLHGKNLELYQVQQQILKSGRSQRKDLKKRAGVLEDEIKAIEKGTFVEDEVSSSESPRSVEDEVMVLEVEDFKNELPDKELAIERKLKAHQQKQAQSGTKGAIKAALDEMSSQDDEAPFYYGHNQMSEVYDRKRMQDRRRQIEIKRHAEEDQRRAFEDQRRAVEDEQGVWEDRLCAQEDLILNNYLKTTNLEEFDAEKQRLTERSHQSTEDANLLQEMIRVSDRRQAMNERRLLENERRAEEEDLRAIEDQHRHIENDRRSKEVGKVKQEGFILRHYVHTSDDREAGCMDLENPCTIA